MSDRYILDDTCRPVKCDDLLTWAAWFEKAERHVAVTDVGENYVSTIFLALDHAFGESEPILWETMIFPRDGSMRELYSDRVGGTIVDAKAMHQKAVEHAKTL